MDNFTRYCPACLVGVSPEHRRCPFCDVRLVAERPSEHLGQTSTVGGSGRLPDLQPREVGEEDEPPEAGGAQTRGLIRRLVLGILFALLVALARAFL